MFVVLCDIGYSEIQSMTWYVYLLICKGGALYTGITTDVERRFAQHLAGKGAKYTRSFPPERVLASWPCASRRIALQLEYAIKRLLPEQKLALAQGVSVPLAAAVGLEDGVWIAVGI